VEPFAGGLAVLLAKEPSKVEVLNDLNGDLVTFYRCVRFHAEPLVTELEWVLNSRQEFEDARHQPGLTDIQRSARWFFRNRTCFGGADMRSFGISAVSAPQSRAGWLELIRELSVRLDRTIIENLEWEACVRRYDRSETFFFLDPPYTECSDTAYAAWTNADVLKLREVLRTLKGSWLVTLNDAPAIRQIFHDCSEESVDRPRGINNRSGASARYRELIIQSPR
jgi:DNA adenine methylase